MRTLSELLQKQVDVSHLGKSVVDGEVDLRLVLQDGIGSEINSGVVTSDSTLDDSLTSTDNTSVEVNLEGGEN